VDTNDAGVRAWLVLAAAHILAGHDHAETAVVNEMRTGATYADAPSRALHELFEEMSIRLRVLLTPEEYRVAEE
jgi:hypothetical protein